MSVGEGISLSTLKKYSSWDKWALQRSETELKTETAVLARLPQDLAARRAKFKQELDAMSRDMLALVKRQLKQLKKSKKPNISLESMVKLAREAAALQEKSMGGMENPVPTPAPAAPTGESPAAAAMAKSELHVHLPPGVSPGRGLNKPEPTDEELIAQIVDEQKKRALSRVVNEAKQPKHGRGRGAAET